MFLYKDEDKNNHFVKCLVLCLIFYFYWKIDTKFKVFTTSVDRLVVPQDRHRVKATFFKDKVDIAPCRRLFLKGIHENI